MALCPSDYTIADLMEVFSVGRATDYVPERAQDNEQR